MGVRLRLGPGIHSVEWLGDGPHESYSDRRASTRFGRWLVAQMEPPPKHRSKTFRKIIPQRVESGARLAREFEAMHAGLIDRVRRSTSLDLSRVKLRSPLSVVHQFASLLLDGVGGREGMVGSLDDISVERPALLDIGDEAFGDFAGGEAAVADSVAQSGN